MGYTWAEGSQITLVYFIITFTKFVHMKRCIGTAAPTVDKALIEAFESRGLDYKDSWTVSNVGTDPDEMGKGKKRNSAIGALR